GAGSARPVWCGEQVHHSCSCERQSLCGHAERRGRVRTAAVALLATGDTGNSALPTRHDDGFPHFALPRTGRGSQDAVAAAAFGRGTARSSHSAVKAARLSFGLAYGVVRSATFL